MEIASLALHFNAGYIRNEYKLKSDVDANKNDIWHFSCAGQLEIVKNFKIAADIGVERNSDKSSNIHPAYILGGFICSVIPNLDIDFGIKAGLNKPATDYSILAGSTFRL